MADIKRTSEYRKLLPFIAKASGDVGDFTIGEDVQALLLALNTHKTSGDHDGRYYTESEIDSALILKADKTITLTAGSGLTGGGNLSANRTFNVAAGFGIDFDSNGNVIVDLTENYAWTGSHSFLRTMYANSIMPHVSDVYDLGSNTSLWRKIFASELSAVVFAKYEQVLLGGWFTVSKGEGVLPHDVLSTDTTIDFGAGFPFTANDMIVFRGISSNNQPQVEYIRVLSLASGTTYNVTRNVDGSGANDWVAGTVYAIYGQAGNGRIELNAYDTPRLSVFSHGANIADFREQIRIGDLINGWGYGSSVYGGAFGAYESGKANITIDPTNGVRLRNYNKTVLQLNGSTAVFGEYASGKPNVLIDSVGLHIRNYTTDIIKLTGAEASFENVIKLGTNGRLQQGSGTWGSNFTGSAIWAEGTPLVMNIGGWNNNVKQWWGGSDGKFYAGTGEIVIDKNGIAIDAPTTDLTDGYNNIRWKRPDGVNIFSVGALYTEAGFAQSSVFAHSTNGQACSLALSSASPDGLSILLLTADSAGIDHPYIKLSDDVLAAPANRFISLNSPTDIRLNSTEVDVGGNLVVDGTIKDGSGNLYGRPVFLTTPKTSTSWNGIAKSTTAKTKIDLSSVFGVPANVKAILVRLTARDSGSSAGYCQLALSPNNIAGSVTVQAYLQGIPNDVYVSESGIVPCDSGGDVYYQITASGTNTLDAFIEIWGWWL